jgi:UDP-N-acetylglucosamine acyltransferase
VHQFCHIGAHSITAIGTVVLQDIPPYVTASGNTAQPYGINSEGLKRRGFTVDAIASIKRAYKTLYKSGLGVEDAKVEIGRQLAQCAELQILLDFLAQSTRGIIR